MTYADCNEECPRSSLAQTLTEANNWAAEIHEVMERIAAFRQATPDVKVEGGDFSTRREGHNH
jgi:hypothetical protein